MKFKDYAVIEIQLNGKTEIEPRFSSKEQEDRHKKTFNDALTNLPRCDSCSYYENASDIETYWHECNNPKVEIKQWNSYEGYVEDVTPRVTRDFGCILHSELEKK